jgi:hypothetical protein
MDRHNRDIESSSRLQTVCRTIYVLTSIHPFEDFNGRLCRLLNCHLCGIHDFTPNMDDYISALVEIRSNNPISENVITSQNEMYHLANELYYSDVTPLVKLFERFDK